MSSRPQSKMGWMINATAQKKSPAERCSKGKKRGEGERSRQRHCARTPIL